MIVLGIIKSFREIFLKVREKEEKFLIIGVIVGVVGLI